MPGSYKAERDLVLLLTGVDHRSIPVASPTGNSALRLTKLLHCNGRPASPACQLAIASLSGGVDCG